MQNLGQSRPAARFLSVWSGVSLCIGLWADLGFQGHTHQILLRRLLAQEEVLLSRERATAQRKAFPHTLLSETSAHSGCSHVSSLDCPLIPSGGSDGKGGAFRVSLQSTLTTPS